MEDGLLYAFSDDREVEMHVGEHFALGLFDKNLLVGYVVVKAEGDFVRYRVI